MTVNSRAKGKRGELEVVQIMRAAGWPASRTSDGRAQMARGDIAGGPPGCHFEVKLFERLNVSRAFDQLLADCPEGVLPVLVHRPSRHEWMATVPFDELLALLALRGGSGRTCRELESGEENA